MRSRWFFPLLGFLLLSACSSSTAPTPPAKAFLDPETKGIPEGVRALCYGRPLNDPEDVRADILASCPKGTRTFQILGQDTLWNRCPLLQPVRITYRCGRPGGQ